MVTTVMAVESIEAVLRACTHLVMDVDGVLTDGRVSVDMHGTERLTFSRRDGHGISMVKAEGVSVVLMTRERGEGPARERARKLEVLYRGGVSDKAEDLRSLDLPLASTIFVGDDLPDLGALAIAGLPCCPADAVREVREMVEIRGGVVIQRCGGEHAVRSLCDQIIAAKRRGH